MFMEMRWLLLANGVSVSRIEALSGARPRPVTCWSDAGDRMRGEWAWEWAACVPSG